MCCYRPLKRPWILLVALASAFLTLCLPGAAIETFSPGMSLPETISQAPVGFGSFGGSYFVPDPIRGAGPNPLIRVVPQNGGISSVFASTGAFHPVGGLFLPTVWGSNAGKFLAVGFSGPIGATYSQVLIYDAAGVGSLFLTKPSSFYNTPLIAPSGFGSFGGQLIVTDQNGSVDAISPSGALTTLVTTPFFDPFGLAFAPASFGAVGGRLLVDSTFGNTILSVDGAGNASTFSTVALAPGQSGLRQMAFAPAGFLPSFGDLLFVSVSGSAQGGGTLGDIVALDSSGTTVASLRTNLGLTTFDPRGIFFTTGGDLLISDGSTNGAILRLGASDFQVLPGATQVPELGTCTLLGAGFLGVLPFLRRRR